MALRVPLYFQMQFLDNKNRVINDLKKNEQLKQKNNLFYSDTQIPKTCINKVFIFF